MIDNCPANLETECITCPYCKEDNKETLCDYPYVNDKRIPIIGDWEWENQGALGL